MLKKIIIISIIITLISSCDLLQKNNCEEKNISFYKLEKNDLVNICDYKQKTSNIILNNKNYFDIQNFYNISNIDKKTGEYILSNLEKQKISKVKKIQLYYILKNIYNYSDEKIENIIGELENQYKEYNISTWRIISAENLLTQVFEGQEESLEGAKDASGTLSYEELIFLDKIFELEPDRFTNIASVANLNGAYNILKNNEEKNIYINMLEKISNNIENNQSKEIINNFLTKK